MILLVETYGTKWGPAKGMRDGLEDVMSCAQREAFEETGVLVTQQELHKAQTWHGYRSRIYYVPLQYDFKKQYIPHDTDEITSIKWFHIDDIDDLNLNCYGRCCIKRFKKVFYATPQSTRGKRWIRCGNTIQSTRPNRNQLILIRY
jgi:ADP-ribose pyrophosphatase YjhB (NUDIX family)